MPPILTFNTPHKACNNNKVSRNKHNILFLPFIKVYNYFFWNYENLYFATLMLFQLLTLGPFPAEWSPTGPYSTAIPLVFCVMLEIVSAVYTWVRNYKHDSIENNRVIQCLDIKKHNKHIYPGDVIMLYKDEICPVDGILLDLESKKDKYGKISLSLLTGESNIHYVEKPDTKLYINDYINTTLTINKFTSMKDLSGTITQGFRTIKIRDCHLIPNSSIIKSDFLYVWVIGCGADKKNSCAGEHSIQRRSRLDVHISNYMTSISSKMLLALILLVSTVKLLASPQIAISSFILYCLQNWICFNGVVPFSVKIFLILIRSVQSYMINRETVFINDSQLIDDIVKVDRIICDKTGTLTKNELDFSKLIQVDSDVIVDVTGSGVGGGKNAPKIDEMLLKCLGLCVHQSDGVFNTVEDEVIRYRYQLLNSRVHQEGSMITICVDGKQEYKYEYVEIAGLDFTYDRKLSSKIVREVGPSGGGGGAGKHYIFTKGAVDKVKSKVVKKYVDEANRLDKLISHDYPDLRLLACAYRELDAKEINKPLTDSSMFITELETNLILLGLIGIKDNIQEDVVKTVGMFHDLGIYCCMCTGDRKITALAVAKDVGILDVDMSTDDIVDLDVSMNEAHSSQNKESDKENENENEKENENKKENEKKKGISANGKTVLISGHKLEALKSDPAKFQKFTNTILTCKNFVAYNLIPDHKRLLTDILEGANIRTLTVGDGFNDISMFNRSQISVSIKGIQHVNDSSNFVINAFRELPRLFEIGVDHYYKNSLLANYTFYRCVCVVMCLVTFSLINYDKLTTAVFNGFVIQAFNFLWCIFPVAAVCLGVNKRSYFSRLHVNAAKNQERSTVVRTTGWIVEGFLTGVIVPLVTYHYFGHTDVFNDILALMIICVLNLRLIFHLEQFVEVISLLSGPAFFVMYMLFTGSLGKMQQLW